MHHPKPFDLRPDEEEAHYIYMKMFLARLRRSKSMCHLVFDKGTYGARHFPVFRKAEN